MTAHLAAVLLSVLFSSAALAAAAPPSEKTIEVELGTQFRLKLGVLARFDDGRGTLRITDFINSPCPKGARCIWSGLAVHYELTVDGKAVANDAADAPYTVTVKDSDYRSYAKFVVDEPVLACSRLQGGVAGECLRSLARRRSDAALCGKISDERTRDLCHEDLAEALHNSELCGKVLIARQYCLYVKAKAAKDLAACDEITTWTWRVRCFKELSKEGGGGPRSCSDLASEPAKRCRETAASK